MSHKYRVVLTSNAQNDIEDIADYIYYTLKAPIAAKNNVKTVSSAIRQLAEYPHRCSYCSEPELSNLGIRKQSIKRYVITFIIDEANNKVIVLRVLHTLVEQTIDLYKTLW